MAKEKDIGVWTVSLEAMHRGRHHTDGVASEGILRPQAKLVIILIPGLSTAPASPSWVAPARRRNIHLAQDIVEEAQTIGAPTPRGEA
jgi:hypothetical protein